MDQIDNRTALRKRFERATQQPPLMMLYPPVSTGEAYGGGSDALSTWSSVSGKATLYIHIPFCQSRCVFCPFHAIVAKPAVYKSYLETVLAEATFYADVMTELEFSSVYFGGGTPSVLPPTMLKDFLKRLGQRLRISGADISLEGNPASLDQDTLKGFCEAGVSRLSLGVQTFDEEVLQASGRENTARMVRSALENALSTPFREVNIDLMYGLPNQTFDSWQEDLNTATALQVPALTLYSTVYTPGFTTYCEKQNATIPGAEDKLRMYDMAYDYLTGDRYPQPHFGAGAFLRGELNPHRENVLLGRPTLGLGTWAYSTTAQTGHHNLFPWRQWAQAVKKGKLPIGQVVRIQDSERARKYVIEAMLLAYLDLGQFQQMFGSDLADTFPDELAVLDELDLVYVEEGELRLTRKGGRHLREIRYMFASNEVVAALENGCASL